MYGHLMWQKGPFRPLEEGEEILGLEVPKKGPKVPIVPLEHFSI